MKETDSLRKYLADKFPGNSEHKIRFAVEELEKANQKFSRYDKAGVGTYAKQKTELFNLQEVGENLIRSIDNLNPMSKDDLEELVGKESIVKLKGYLGEIIEGVKKVRESITQESGRSPILPNQRWIMELADIYEHISRVEPKVSGSGSKRDKYHGPFWSFVEECRPFSVLRKTELSPRTVGRYLKKRAKLIKKISDDRKRDQIVDFGLVINKKDTGKEHKLF